MANRQEHSLLLKIHIWLQLPCTELKSLAVKDKPFVACNSDSWKTSESQPNCTSSDNSNLASAQLGVQTLSKLGSPPATSEWISGKEGPWFRALHVPVRPSLPLLIHYSFIESKQISFPTPSPWTKPREEGKHVLAYAEYRDASCPLFYMLHSQQPQRLY